jgi:hypothetical protein
MNEAVSTTISVTINEGCPIRYGTEGSSEATFVYGSEPPETFELAMHSEVLREFLVLGAEALAKMDALYAQEETADS